MRRGLGPITPRTAALVFLNCHKECKIVQPGCLFDLEGGEFLFKFRRSGFVEIVKRLVEDAQFPGDYFTKIDFI